MNNKDKIENLTKKFVKSVSNLLDGENDQCLVLIYNKESLLTYGYGCRACAVKIALEFAELNTEEKHEIKETIN